MAATSQTVGTYGWSSPTSKSIGTFGWVVDAVVAVTGGGGIQLGDILVREEEEAFLLTLLFLELEL